MAQDPYTAKAKEDIPLKDKTQELTKFMEECKYAMMTTINKASGLMSSRAMAIAAAESNGVNLVFHTNLVSGKVEDIESDSNINVAFISDTGQWASVAGTAVIEKDRERVRKHYSPALKAWLGDLGDGKHDGGPEDPRIGLINVKAKSVTYATANKGATGQAIDLAKGMTTGVTGQAIDVAKGMTIGDNPGIRLKDITEEECEMARKGQL